MRWSQSDDRILNLGLRRSNCKADKAACANLANSANWRGSESVNSDDMSHRGALSRDVTYGRSDRIRTCDLVNPNHALYQSEPHPDILLSIAQKASFVKGFGKNIYSGGVEAFFLDNAQRAWYNKEKDDAKLVIVQQFARDLTSLCSVLLRSSTPRKVPRRSPLRTRFLRFPFLTRVTEVKIKTDYR